MGQNEEMVNCTCLCNFVTISNHRGTIAKVVFLTLFVIGSVVSISTSHLPVHNYPFTVDTVLH